MNSRIIFKLFFILSFFTSIVSAQQPKAAPKTISGGVVNSKASSLPKPEYSEAARAVRAGGAVNVQVVIDEQGNVASASAVSGHPLLRAEAENAARQAKFNPTYLSGQAVKVTGVIIYNFILQEKPSGVFPATEKNIAFVFGIMFSLFQKTDDELLREILSEDGKDDFLTELFKDIPAELASEKPMFEKLSKASGETRRAIAVELLESIKKRLNNAERWEVEMGERFGVVLLELGLYGKSLQNGAASPDIMPLRTGLEKFRDLLSAAPPSASREIFKQLKIIAAFADEKDLNSPDKLKKFFQVVEPLMNSIDND